TERGRLLVAEDAGDGSLTQQGRALCGAVHLGGRLDLWQHRARYTELLQNVITPLERLQIHEHGSGGVGDIGDVNAAIGPTGEVPQNPGVGGPEQEVTCFCFRASSIDVLKDPRDLGSGEVRCQWQSDDVLEAIDAFVAGKPVDDRL